MKRMYRKKINKKELTKNIGKVDVGLALYLFLVLLSLFIDPKHISLANVYARGFHFASGKNE